MLYQEQAAQVREFDEQIKALREKQRTLRIEAEPESVKDYRFSTPAGAVTLGELFGDKTYLFVIHNMGAGCSYCTMWADGFNGVLPHLENRAAFVLTSPDDPAAQQKFKESRGWTFRMVSHKGTSFAADMGYARPGGGCLPGVSVFKKEGGRILRVSDTSFGPHDDFCSVWHFLDLLPEGPDGWGPKFKY
jgi:predicted dithiol-disulfide oxidoreductase (DUF899 family)